MLLVPRAEQRQKADAVIVFMPDPEFAAAQARANARPHVDDAEFALHHALGVLQQVRTEAGWDAPAARAFRWALYDHVLMVESLQREVSRLGWEAGL